ncbi:MAG TPA: IreB family regulatory phosphoprotein [Firmicutes bacterium]|jgi:uncharacterized protein (UPF0297 family)|nr:IreB family regulatory phosphoprotein [Bacillota bacterium]
MPGVFYINVHIRLRWKGHKALDEVIGRKSGSLEETKHFSAADISTRPSVREVLAKVAGALTEKGYRPVDQLVGFLVTGDPAYITSHNDARLWIKKLERDEILEEILQEYLDHTEKSEGK